MLLFYYINLIKHKYFDSKIIEVSYNLKRMEHFGFTRTPSTRTPSHLRSLPQLSPLAKLRDHSYRPPVSLA